MITILAFVAGFSLLIFVHELGHFIAARRNGITVEEFGFGYPPRVKTLFHYQGIPITLNAIPFGGFVRMRGEDGPAGPGSLSGASKRARAITLLAGPGMNLLLAILFFTLAYLLGWPQVGEGARINVVVPHSPAEAAGLQTGDVVIRADDVPVRTVDDLTRYTDAHRGQAIALLVQRGGQAVTIVVTPRVNPPPGEGAIGVAIVPVTVIRGSPLPDAFVHALQTTVDFVRLTLELPILLLRGLIPVEMARPVGPVGIAQITGEAVQASLDMGWWFPVLQLMGILSAALGVTNLLPLPALDGGRLLFVIIEAVRGRRVAPEKEGLVHFLGMVFLLTLMVLITYQDIVSPIAGLDWTNLGS